MSRAQWNGTLRLHRPDPSHRVFCYCSCKQDAEERFSGQQFCQMERDELMNWLDQLKWTTFKDGLKYFRSDWTEKVHSTWFLTEIYRYLSWIENSQVLFLSLKIDTVLQFANNSGQTTASGQFLSQRYHRDVHVCKSLVTYNSSLFIYYRVYLGSQENRALLEEVEIREIVDPKVLRDR